MIKEDDRLNIDLITSLTIKGVAKDGRKVDICFYNANNTEINILRTQAECMEYDGETSTIKGPKKANISFEFEFMRYVYGSKESEYELRFTHWS